MIVKSIILYFIIGVFYGAEFKFTGPNTWNFTIHQFLDSGPRPQGDFYG